MEEQKDDVISQLVVEQIKPGTLSKEDAVQMAFLLLVAGNATMVNMISLVSLLRNRPSSSNKATNAGGAIDRAW